MNQNILTVGDLRRLLADKSDDTPLAVAAAPDVTGYTNHILAVLGTDENGTVVLALAEETTSEQERDLAFTDANGNAVRPV